MNEDKILRCFGIVEFHKHVDRLIYFLGITVKEVDADMEYETQMMILNECIKKVKSNYGREDE